MGLLAEEPEATEDAMLGVVVNRQHRQTVVVPRIERTVEWREADIADRVSQLKSRRWRQAVATGRSHRKLGRGHVIGRLGIRGRFTKSWQRVAQVEV
jgi:hypothetical protein